MTKVVRAYVDTAPVSFDLLKSINAGQTISEGPFMDKLKGAVKGAVSGFKGGDKPAPAEEPKDETPDRQAANAPGSGDSSLKAIAREVMSTADHRFVLFTDKASLGSLYLKPGGGKLIVDNIKDDADLTAFAEAKDYQGRFRLQPLPPKFRFNDLINSKMDFAVLIDAPKQLVDELATNKSNPNALRQTLTKLMLHKYYVASLNLAKAKKIGPAMTKAGQDDEKIAVAFDPRVLENYPNRQTLLAAIDEWDNEFGGEGKKDADVQAKIDARNREARDPDNASALGSLSDTLQHVFASNPVKGNDEEAAKQITDKIFTMGKVKKLSYAEMMENLAALAKVWGKGSLAGQVHLKVGANPGKWQGKD